MKKRKLCTWNASRFPGNSPTPLHGRELDNYAIKTKSVHDLKRLQRSNSKIQKKSGEHGEPSFKRDAFGSLESLFDLKKPLNLSDIRPLTFEYHQEGYVLPFESKNNKNRLESLFLKPQVEFEPHILERPYDVNDYNDTLKKIEEEPRLEVLTLQKIENSKHTEETPLIMAEPAEEVAEAVEEAEVEAETTETAEAAVVEETEDIEIVEEEEMPPPHPIPEGVGEGVPIKPGGREESILSSSPLTDTAVMMEMKKADERCVVLSKEIEQLKQEIAELSTIKDLTDEDTLTIHAKQDQVMKKLAEFEQITRKLQRLLGLSDLSSSTFAKMFDMIPIKPTAIIDEEEELKSKVDMVDEKTDMELVGAKDRFDLPQIEYPEDKLPRVIVCGYTEDDIPKIVVADSKKKGKARCLESLTGKLTESLTMQEKLVFENAQLEGGKYKLEEALLEKDSAVDNLQRKVCGLQAEMRIVVKENVELTRQLACLNQRITSPCCYTCPGGISSGVSSPSPLRSVSYTTTLHQDDDYCRCKCCLQTQFADNLSPNTACVRPDSYSGLPSGDSPRLAGGACITSGTPSQIDEMCCRSPATIKTPCPGLPPPPRGTCPAELENKLAAYGNSTKQLEQQLGSMECEVRNMQMELANVQRERQQLEQQRKLLKCTGPCAPCGCCPPPPSLNLQTSSSPPFVPPVPIMQSSPIPLPKVSMQYFDQFNSTMRLK